MRPVAMLQPPGPREARTRAWVRAALAQTGPGMPPQVMRYQPWVLRHCGSMGHQTGVAGLSQRVISTYQQEAGGGQQGAGVFVGCNHELAATGNIGHGRLRCYAPNLG
jgi:hypothetical protein